MFFCHSSINNVDSSVEKSWDPTLDPNLKIKHDRKTTRKKQLIFNNVVSKLMSQVDLSILNDNSMIIQHWEPSSKKYKKIKLLIVGCYFSHFLDQRRSPFTLITTRQIIRHHKTLINHWPSYFTDATADTMKRFFTENVFFLMIEYSIAFFPSLIFHLYCV